MKSVRSFDVVRRLQPVTFAFALLLIATKCGLGSPWPTATPADSQISEPEATLGVPEPLRLRDRGFTQEENRVSFGFIVENPNDDLALEGSGYELSVLAEDGTQLGTDSGIIQWVPAGERWGVGGRIALEPEQPGTVARLEINLRSGDAIASYPQPKFEVRRIRVFTDSITSRVTALVNNPYRLPVTDVRVSVVAFGENDTVVGGSFAYVEVLPGEAPAGVEVQLAPVKAPKRVELYVARSSLSNFVDSEARPEGVRVPVVLGQGFSQEGRTLAWAAKIANPNDGWGHVGLRYHLTAFDKEGDVL
ncbi:MAG: hypothetical protein ACP5JG_01325 [Anaerolineae bacterium]